MVRMLEHVAFVRLLLELVFAIAATPSLTMRARPTSQCDAFPQSPGGAPPRACGGTDWCSSVTRGAGYRARYVDRRRRRPSAIQRWSAAHVSGFMDLPGGSTSGVSSRRKGRADRPRSRSRVRPSFPRRRARALRCGPSPAHRATSAHGHRHRAGRRSIHARG
jgi:hypothetical protein